MLMVKKKNIQFQYLCDYGLLIICEEKKKERIHSRADKLWLKKYQFLLRENSQRADWSMVKGKSDFSIEENASPSME